MLRDLHAIIVVTRVHYNSRGMHDETRKLIEQFVLAGLHRRDFRANTLHQAPTLVDGDDFACFVETEMIRHPKGELQLRRIAVAPRVVGRRVVAQAVAE